MAAGEMPNLARLVAGGASGNLATLSPPLSPMLWTSIATGKRPTKHGIHGFSEPLPDGSGVRPITTLGRNTKAVWNILNQNGVRPSVVGWWPSHPAEPIGGVMVSNHFHEVVNYKSPGPLPRGTIHPPDWHERLAGLRTAPMSLPGEVMRLFVPEYDRVDQEKDKRLHSLATVISETMSMHAAATEVIEHAEWDIAAVYYDAIDHFCHGFMRYNPPRLAHVDEEDFALYGGVIANAYRYHDAMLGRLIQLAGPETTVIVMSDHGFHPDALRPEYIPAEAAGPAVEHRHFGMFTINGPGIRAGETIYGATLLDVTPTLLHLFGLPVGRDMDGKVLSTVFESAGEIRAIDSWDEVEGDAGTHAPGTQVDAVASAEAMKQLVALGYVAPPGEDAARGVAETVAELKYNLARAHADAGDWHDAALLFEELHAGDAGDHRFIDRAISALIATRQAGRARKMLDDFDTRVATSAPEAAAELKRRREAKPDSELKQREEPKDKRESYERRALQERSSGFGILRLMLRLRIDLADEWFEEARRDLAGLEKLYANAERAPAMMFARAYVQLKDDVRALQWTGKALERDPDDWEALALAARIHVRKRRFAAASDAALVSLSLIYFQPVTHFLLGRSLAAQRDDDHAARSFQTALHQMPGLVPAHSALARLYDRRGEKELASGHRVRARELLRSRKLASSDGSARVRSAPAVVVLAADAPFEERHARVGGSRSDVITIVAGLPRSGTSMLMQFLAAGGMEPLTDGLRVADPDNPRGYLEFEPATNLARDVSWIPHARGKVVKLALPLLPHLPGGEAYRILIIERDSAEVIASQRAMVKRLGRAGASLDDASLAAEYGRQRKRVLRWLGGRPEVAVLPLRYGAVLSDPQGTAFRVASFLKGSFGLGGSFDGDAAAAAIDPGLRRQVA
jgi:tetratricopeptide (TPR) repeat protein